MNLTFIGYNPVAYYLLKILPLVLMGVLIFNLVQRKFIPNWGRKRMASLFLALLLLVQLAGAYLVFSYRSSDLLLIPVFLGIVVVAVWKRRQIFPFRIRCESCGRNLNLIEILLKPEEQCRDCLKAPAGDTEQREE